MTYEEAILTVRHWRRTMSNGQLVEALCGSEYGELVQRAIRCGPDCGSGNLPTIEDAQREVVRNFEAQAAENERRQTCADPVNRPPHYNAGEIEVIDFIRDQLGPDGFAAYCRGNAMKYLARFPHKGKPVEDLKKANWYIDRLRETVAKEGER